MSKMIKRRFNEMKASPNFKEYVSYGIGKPHPLTGNLDKLYGISLNKNYRLIVKPLIENLDFSFLEKCKTVDIKGAVIIMMEKSNGLSLELIVHPGETIKELLNDKNMSQEELAIRTCYSAKHISEVLSGKKSISFKFANALEYVFGIPTEFWINLQGIYDKEILELEKLNNIKEEFIILDELKDIVKYCESCNIITSGLNKSLQVLTMRKFFEVNDLTVISHLSFDQMAFRASKKVKANTNVLYAWKRLCEYLT